MALINDFIDGVMKRIANDPTSRRTSPFYEIPVLELAVCTYSDHEIATAFQWLEGGTKYYDGDPTNGVAAIKKIRKVVNKWVATNKVTVPITNYEHLSSPYRAIHAKFAKDNVALFGAFTFDKDGEFSHYKGNGRMITIMGMSGLAMSIPQSRWKTNSHHLAGMYSQHCPTYMIPQYGKFDSFQEGVMPFDSVQDMLTIKRFDADEWEAMGSEWHKAIEESRLYWTTAGKAFT